MAAASETRQVRKLRQAIRRAEKPWAALYRAEAALLEAWEACTDSERRAARNDEGLLAPASPREFFRNLGA